jgi:hypothetical protein
MDFTWLGIQIHMDLLVTETLKKEGVWIRKPVSIWCDHHLHRVDQAADCGLWNDVPLLFSGCAKLLDIGGNWNMLSYTSIQSIPNMLNWWHVWWVCRSWQNWNIFSFYELCTDPCDMGPCIIMLKHEVMAVDEWPDNGPQDLITVSLCIQFAIDNMQWGTLFVTLTSASHSPTRCNTCCLPSAQYSWFICEGHTNPASVAIEGEHLPTKVG